MSTFLIILAALFFLFVCVGGLIAMRSIMQRRGTRKNVDPYSRDGIRKR